MTSNYTKFKEDFTYFYAKHSILSLGSISGSATLLHALKNSNAFVFIPFKGTQD
jgi:hypothetical protein